MQRVMLAVIIAVGLGIASATAQPYPSRPITLIVPYPPGGPLDQVARVVTEHMRGTLGQPIVIENVSGAGGSIGTGRLARATPNGYTFGIGDVGTQVLNGAVYPLNYDVMTDFEPIASLVASPLLVLSRSSLPTKTLTELVAWLRANEGKVSQGYIGSGTLSHLCGLYLQQTIGSKWIFVPYRGGAPAIQDLIGGQVDIMCLAPSGSTLPLSRSGQIRAYAIMSPTRLPSAPEIPTADEAGVPGLLLSFWQALWAPKGTPKEIIDRLNGAAVAALADQDIRAKLTELGQIIPSREEQTPEALARLRRTEADRWWPIIKAAGIKPD